MFRNNYSEGSISINKINDFIAKNKDILFTNDYSEFLIKYNNKSK